MNLSDRVRACREAAGLTQAELATRACVSQQLIAKLETGDVRETRKLPNLAKAFGMTVDEFLEFVHADREANAIVRNNARQILADNIASLVRQYGSQSALAKAARLPQKTISRAINSENAATLDTLNDLAHGLGIEPWQLLFPGQITMPAELHRLRRRLETTAEDGTLLPQSADGIACRDETIRLLDQRVQRLEQKLKENRS